MPQERTMKNTSEERGSSNMSAHVNPAELSQVNEIAERLAVSNEDVLDAIEQVGDDPKKIEEVLRGRENSY